MALSTALAGSVALATIGVLGALGDLGGPKRQAILFQLGCLAASCAVLAVAGPGWKRHHAEQEEAEVHLRMYEEL